MKTEFSIRDLASEFGVTARTLRFYEQKGLLNPGRKGASRVYSLADRARLVLILRGKRVGFSLDEIREMLDLEAITTRDPSALSDTLERFNERIAALHSQREDIDAAIEELEAGRIWLEDRLANREPSEEIKHRARAFEALATARMNVWTGASPEPGSHETQS
ncbi:MerR family DNA-binding transcriptional regulator [Hyphobacterium sp. HN65]|uniref:MerR family DNA-binding transcriptional regulator n=1 Tax=Hyphobacterium lacteum TaxID=3116575 RepID=A0ABU7LNB4_9PROT|nr:MerR family DNA-binding transcriptional regulator [Hyphobacterium sp. HN65]MEE2525405.1 MerR family DNA-binding transcriptional regulator [Hyphobacterium sp. HN65]